jgi:hypothetical protein
LRPFSLFRLEFHAFFAVTPVLFPSPTAPPVHTARRVSGR